jgi:hypothetical protein
LYRARLLIDRDAAGERAQIEDEIEAARAEVEASHVYAARPWLHVERAALAEALGDEPGRLRELREALRQFRELGATGHVEKLARELRQ